MRKLVCLLLTVLSCDVMAQITTASLRGVVNDSSDQILAGAVVTLSHSVTGTVYTVATNAEGYYSIHGIRPDEGYSLEVNYLGYKPYRIDGMALRVGDTHVENITMKEDSMLDAVVVATSSREDADMLAKFDEKAIERVPSVTRSLYDVVRLIPEAMATKNGGMSYGGVNNRYNSFMINGMANSDMYGLSTSGTNGGLSNANPVAMDAIAQIPGSRCALRRASERFRRRSTQCRDQIGHERIPRQRLHLLQQSGLLRLAPRRHRIGPAQQPRTADHTDLRRHARRPHRQGQTLLLRKRRV